ncbi:Spy/CpxP family protein refolding chaperone [Acidobacteriota bacterium]
MKKTAIMSVMVIISFLLVSQGLSAQRYLSGASGTEGDFCPLNLTQEQIEKIKKLDLDLEKELLPLLSKLRSIYMEIEDLEAQRNPDIAKIEKIWETILKYESDIQNKEILYEKKIRDLLTEEQKASIDSFIPYGRGGFGRGNIGRGYGRYGAGMGQNDMGRGAGMMSRGFYGYGNVITRSYGRNIGYLGQGAGRINYGNVQFLPGVRYGRGPCGAGLGRWIPRVGLGRGRWNWR